MWRLTAEFVVGVDETVVRRTGVVGAAGTPDGSDVADFMNEEEASKEAWIF